MIVHKNQKQPRVANANLTSTHRSSRQFMHALRQPTWCIFVLILSACGRTTANMGSKASLKPPADGELVTLRGHLSDGGEATGKSMAALQGFQAGERIFFLTLDPHQMPNIDTVMVHESALFSLHSWTDKHVRVTGVWRVSSPVIPDPMVPRQMPIHVDGAQTNVWQPRPTIIIRSVTPL